jgi:hypothetical protein
MTLVALITLKLFNNSLDSLFVNVVKFGTVTLFSFVTYFGFTRILKVEESRKILKQIKKLF